MADHHALAPADTLITSLAHGAAIMPPSPPVTSPQAQPHLPPPDDHEAPSETRVLRPRSHNQFQVRPQNASQKQQNVVLHLDSSPLPDQSTLTSATLATAMPRTDSGLAIQSQSPQLLLLCNPPTTRSYAQFSAQDDDPHPVATNNSHSSSLSAPSDGENSSSARPTKRLRTAPRTPEPEPSAPASASTATATATVTTAYAPPSPLKSDDLLLSSPALYLNLRNAHSTSPSHASQLIVPPQRSHLERLPAQILTKNIAGRYIQQVASLFALAAASRNLFSKIAPLVWRDPWDFEAAPVTRLGGTRYQDDPTLLQAVRNGMALGVEVDGNLDAATGYYAQQVAYIPSQSLSQPWTKQTRAHATLQLTLESALPKKAKGVCVDFASVTGIIADLTAEKHRLRLVESFWTSILLPRASTLTTLHIEIATPLFAPMSTAIAQAGGDPIWPHLRDLSLAFHVGTQPEHMRQLAGVLKAHADELRTLSLTMLNSADVRVLEPLRDVGESLCNLRRIHIVPADDAISPLPSLALWLDDFLAGFPTATFRHLEIYPATEYSRSSYFTRSLASLPADHSPSPGVHRLTLWLPHSPHAIAKHVLPLARAWGGDTLTHLDCAPYTQHPRANWGGQAPLIAFAGRDRSLHARFARTAGGMVIPSDFGSKLAAAAPALDTLHMYCLAIDESLAHLASLKEHASLVHVHLGLAPPCLQASPLDPPPRRVAPELAQRMANKVSTYGAYAYLGDIARALVVARKPESGKPIRSMSWMCLPMKAGEARVFDVDQAEYVASMDRETGRKSVVGEMGLVMRYEEDALATWAVCGLGVHACVSIRRSERERRAREEEQRRGPLTRRQAAMARNG